MEIPTQTLETSEPLTRWSRIGKQIVGSVLTSGILLGTSGCDNRGRDDARQACQEIADNGVELPDYSTPLSELAIKVQVTSDGNEFTWGCVEDQLGEPYAQMIR